MFALNPQSQITKLKETVPEAGRLYGVLSDQAHIPPRVSLRYLDFSKADDPGIYFTMFQYSDIDLTMLAKLTDAYCVCVGVVAASTRPRWGCASVSADGSIKISKRRETLRWVRRVERRFAGTPRVQGPPNPALLLTAHFGMRAARAIS